MNPEEILCVLDAHKDNKSNKQLIIFDTEKEKRKCINYYLLGGNENNKYILISLEHMRTSRNALVGRRFRSYKFVEVDENGKIRKRK